MIHLPRRSVTRFFIPLIDVLTLLFCIFLLLPVVQAPDADAESRLLASEERLRQLQAQLDAQRRTGEIPRQLQEDIERLKQERARALQEHLAVRVLEIDSGSGKLYYRDRDRQKIEVRNQADARALIERDRREHGRRELYYLILYPRVRSSYPTVGQRRQYEHWFEGVALGFDVPGAEPEGGKS